MRAVVATHGHCFDGLCSAVLFSRLLRHTEGKPVDCRYVACGYGPTALDLSKLLTGDHNGILDYRFAATERLDWYFDHHRTAFATGEDAAWFEARKSERQFFYDPAYSSCTKLVWDLAKEHFDWREEHFAELVRWADVIDAARFDSAADAVDRSHPVRRLVSVVEQHGSSSLLERLVPQLHHQSLAEVAASSWVESRYKPIHESRQRFTGLVESKSRQQGPVVLVDLTDAQVDAIAKFVTYALYPDSTYSVVAARLGSGVKLSIGYNPWSGNTRHHDISAICARYGGGGHPYVGGISFALADVERARHVAGLIAAELAA